MKDQNDLSLLERFVAPTPKLFALIRNIGVILAMASMAIKTLPEQGIALPDAVLFFADKAYALAGVVAALVAQFTVDFKAHAKDQLLSKISPRK